MLCLQQVLHASHASPARLRAAITTSRAPPLHHPAPLQTGAVLNRVWQPHESRIPYLLQLKIDYNLAGMGWLRLRTARFR